MTDKLPMLAIYAAVGLLLALWPLALRPSGAGAGQWPASSAARAQTWLTWLGLIVGLLVGSVLPWWRHAGGFGLTLSVGEAAVLAAIVAVFIAVFLRPASAATSAAGRQAQTALFVLAAGGLSFCTLTYQHGEVLNTAWHHWGAYIGPSELLLAGARIFRDFPPQYGLGPTLLIASACDKACWAGTYYLVGLLTFLYASVTAALALRVAAPVGLAQRALVLLLVLACCFFWTAYPPMLGSPTATPSVNGMRFLPVLALVALLLRADRQGREFPYWIGHLAWSLAALWSFESAFYATCVWWPYFLLLRQAASGAPALSTLLRSVGKLALVLAAWIACFLLGYGLVYQTTPTFMGLFAYIIYPPGALPVNLSGTIWFFASVIALASWVNLQDFRRSGNTASLRHGMALSLLAYATFSYFIGRSHDNNVLNLLPFLLLVLLHAWVRSLGFCRGLAVALLAGLLGWFSVFGWEPWQGGAQARAQAWFDPHWIRAALPGPGPGSDRFPESAQQVLAQTQRLAARPVTVMGPTANPSSTSADAVWSALHAPANLYMFAPAIRREFLRQSAATLRRSGWLVVQTSQPLAAGLVEDFDSVYTRVQEFETAGYLAILYAPTP